MPVATARKVEALRADFRSAAQLADMLGVSRSQVTRWLRGAGHRSAERGEGRPARARLVEPAAPVREGGRALVALRPQPAARRPPPDRSRARGTHGGADARAPRRALRRVRVILYRCFAWNERARPGRPWTGRSGSRGRSRARAATTTPISTAASTSPIARCRASSSSSRAFAASGSCPPLLRRRGLPLALAELELDDARAAARSRRSRRAPPRAPAPVASSRPGTAR